MSEALTNNTWITDIHGTLNPVAIVEYVELWRKIQAITLSQDTDKLSWKCTSSDVYSASSCYRALFHGSTIAPSWRLIWKNWAPTNAKIFLWLASLNRCWTADRRARHGLTHDPICKLCCQADETLDHLLTGCVLSRMAWHDDWPGTAYQLPPRTTR